VNLIFLLLYGVSNTEHVTKIPAFTSILIFSCTVHDHSSHVSK